MTHEDYSWFAVSIIFLVVALVLYLLKRARLRRAHTWPTEAGQVDSTDIRLEQRGNNQSIYVAEVHYSYTAQGAPYPGKLRRTFMRKSSAEKWTGAYKNGRPVVIRCNPAKVTDSVLFEKEQAGGAGVN